MISEYVKRARALFLVILSVAAFASAAFAKGGDMVVPFPATDVRAESQFAKAMTVDAAGNTIVAGYSNNGSNKDCWLVKFKADGSGLAWAPVYYGGSGDDIATAVAVDAFNNIIVTGTSWNGTNDDIHTIKYSGASGAVLWEHTYNSGGADAATALTVDAAGDVYVAGYAFNGTAREDFLLLKYPSAGATPAWVKLYDDATYPNNENRIVAIASGTGGIAVTGYSYNGSDFDILTQNYGSDGTLIREWRYASSAAADDRGSAVRIDSLGNVIIAGYVTNTDGNTDSYVAMYDPAYPVRLWEQTYDGHGNDAAKGVWIDSDGDVYVVGETSTLAGGHDFFTARYAGSDGTLKWRSIFDSGTGSVDMPVAVVVDSAVDGAVFVSGYTTVSANEDYLTLKYRKDNGELLWQTAWNGSAANNDRPVGMALDPSSHNVIVAGWTVAAATLYDFAVLKYDFGALNPPTGLSATAASNSSITLSWNDNSANEDNFVIQRKLGEAGTFADIFSAPANAVSSTDAGLVANNYYYYRVRAVNAANGDSSYSNEAHALTKVVNYVSPLWTFIYNSADGRTDQASAITVGSDDHPIVTGSSDMTEEGVAGHYSFDYMTFKLDRSDASIKWRARYDSSDTDQAEGVVVDNDGNLLVTGTSNQMGATDKSFELYTIKYSTAGYGDPVNTPPVLWADQYGTQNGVDHAVAIEAVHDAANNSVVIGYGGNPSGNDDIFIIKYAADGTRVWTPIVYDSGRYDYPTGLALDAAGDIFVSGYSFDTGSTPGGSYDWFTAKYSGATGTLLWSDSYNASSAFGAGSRDDQALSIDVDGEGNAFVSGYATDSNGISRFYTVKYDGKLTPSGTRRIWEKSFNYPGFDADAAVVKIDPLDGAVVVAGSAYLSATDSDFHLIRYNPLDGAVIWERNFDKPESYDYAYAMTLDASGYIYLAGDIRAGTITDPAFDSSSDVMTLLYDFEGTFLGASHYNGAAGNRDEATGIAVNHQGESFVAGFSINAAGNADYVVLKNKNDYILVPAPLTATAQADYTKIDLGWRENTPGSSFRIERTPGPATPSSVWELIASPASGTTNFTDTDRAANVSYCYRIDASIGSLSSRKLEKCTTTGIPAPVLAPLTVDSATQISLSWNQVADNNGYKVERKVTAGGSWTELVLKTAGVTAHVDSGLTPGTSYYYRVSASSAAGYSLASNEQNAATRPAAPAMAANGTITATTAVINWTNVAGESGFRLERKEGSGGTYAEIGTTAADVLSYSDTGLAATTQYYYRIRAYNASGDSEYSAGQGALTPLPSPILSAAAGSSTSQIDLAWTAVAGATGYTIQEAVCNSNGNDNDQYCTSVYLGSRFITWATVATVASDVLAYQRSTTLASGYAYAYRIVATTAGNSSVPSNTRIAWTYLTPPTLSVTPTSVTSLTAVWSNINGATNYTLERKLGTAGTYADVTGAIGLGIYTTSFLDAGLSQETQYCYRVKAYSSTLDNPPPLVTSTEFCQSTPAAAPVLNPPTGITAAQVDLSWNNVAGTTGYELQRCNYSQLDYPQQAATNLNNDAYWSGGCTIIPVTADTSVYQNTGLASGYTYRYRVRYTSASGTSAWSNGQAVTTVPPAPSIYSISAPSTAQISFYIVNVYGETGYQLEWKPRSGSDCSAGSWNTIPLAQNAWNYNHTGLSAGTYYCYRIYAVGSAGNSGNSAEVSQTTRAIAPALDPLSGVTATQATLSWNSIAGNGGYTIERKIGAGGAWSTLAWPGVNVVNYTDSTLSAGTLYFYRVSTNNAAGASVPSNEQSTTTTPQAPTVAVNALSAVQLDISWARVKAATNYKIEEKIGTGSYTQIDNLAVEYAEDYCGDVYPTAGCPALTAKTTVYQRSGLTENTSYCYQVRAWNNSGGDSPTSTEQCATTPLAPPNLANQTLSGSALNAFKIKLDWSAAACDPVCENPDGFELERQAVSGIWINIKTADAATLSYTDTIAIEPNNRYSYRIRTYKGAYKSAYSAVADVTTPLFSADSMSCP